MIKNIFSINKLKNFSISYIAHKKRKIPIIMYHRFIKHKNKQGNARIYINIKRLEKHFQFLKKRNYETLTFADLTKEIFINKLQYDKKLIIITIDDGYEDSYFLLFPLLKKYNFKAVIYMVTGEIYNKWDVDNLQEPKVSLMNNQQLIEMANSGLVEIGGHTLTHPDLTKLTYKQQYQEIEKNKLHLEYITNQHVISFAYPYGLFNEFSKKIVKEIGYKFAVAVEKNAVDSINQDLYRIKRINIDPMDNILFFWFKTTGYFWKTNKIYSVIIKLLFSIKKNLFFIYNFFTTFKNN